jgi:hypothetical protein
MYRTKQESFYSANCEHNTLLHFHQQEAKHGQEMVPIALDAVGA